jgi:hypothetical protein
MLFSLTRTRGRRRNADGKRLFAAGRPFEAREAFQEAADLGVPAGWYNLGLLYGYFQNEAAGMESYQRGFAIDQDWKRHADLRLIPNYVQIETVRTCNAACIMCPLAESPTQHRSMSDEHFEKLVRQLAEMTTRPQVAMHGLNEPLMDKKLVRRIKFLKDLGIKKVNVVSNATLMTRQTADALIGAGIDAIAFSIDSIDADTYENIRLKLKLSDALGGVLSFIEARNAAAPELPITILFQYSQRNREQFATYREFWSQHLKPGTDMIALQAIHSFGVFPDEMQIRDNNDACGQLFCTMHLRAGGEVSMCCIDVESEWAMGDATKTSLVDIFNSDRIRLDRHRHLMGLRNEMSLCAGCDQPECGKIGFGDNLLGDAPRMHGAFFMPPLP